MKQFLKIKIKSLAAEAKIIRHMERNTKAQRADLLRERLHEHRTLDVRRECRAANLAYGFLRGRGYRRLEAKCHEKPNWANVERMILKYGDADKRDLKQRFAEWKDEKQQGGAVVAR